MGRQNADGFRSLCVRWFRAMQLTLGGLLMMAASGHAGVLTASWTAPTTNTDGSTLTQLAFYRIYYSESNTPCPGSTFFEVVSPTSTPLLDQTVRVEMTGLTTGSIYSASVTAVDIFGNESACSDVTSAIARDDSVATPAAPDATTTAPDATTSPERFCPPGQAKQGRC